MVMDLLAELGPVQGTALCTLFTWLVTACGAAVVFFFGDVKGNEGLLNLFLGFGAGVMIAASFWSLLSPAIEMSHGWVLPALGFGAGGLFILLADRWLDVCHLGGEEWLRSNKRSFLLILAVTLHNIPEGMAIGVAFGGTGGVGPWLLALGIGLQNFPEGAAVSLPLRREGLSRRKSFFYGQASGIVEPIAGIAGVLAALYLGNILPFLLSFAAGAMIAVTGGELIPEAASANKQVAVSGLLLGFLLMMVLDVALG